MKIYQPQSKNVATVTWAAGFALLGSIILAIFKINGVKIYEGPGQMNPYVGALSPLVQVGVPMLLLAGFIFSVYSIGREETLLGKYQLAATMLIILCLAYLYSFAMFVEGGSF